MAAKFGETCRIHLSHIHADQVDCCGSPCASSPFDEVRSFNSLKGHRWVLHGTSRWYIAMAIDSCRFFQQTSSVLGCANRICCAFSDCSPTGPEERTLGEDARTVSTVFFLVSGGFLTKKSFVGANWLLQF